MEKDRGITGSIVRPTNTVRFNDRLLKLDKKLNSVREKTTTKKYINYQFNFNINVNNYGDNVNKLSKK
jgi:hypothetical protein